MIVVRTLAPEVEPQLLFAPQCQLCFTDVVMPVRLEGISSNPQLQASDVCSRPEPCYQLSQDDAMKSGRVSSFALPLYALGLVKATLPVQSDMYYIPLFCLEAKRSKNTHCGVTQDNQRCSRNVARQ